MFQDMHDSDTMFFISFRVQECAVIRMMLRVLGVGFEVCGSDNASIFCDDKFRYVHSPTSTHVPNSHERFPVASFNI